MTKSISGERVANVIVLHALINLYNGVPAQDYTDDEPIMYQAWMKLCDGEDSDAVADWLRDKRDERDAFREYERKRLNKWIPNDHHLFYESYEADKWDGQEEVLNDAVQSVCAVATPELMDAYYEFRSHVMDLHDMLWELEMMYA